MTYMAIIIIKVNDKENFLFFLVFPFWETILRTLNVRAQRVRPSQKLYKNEKKKKRKVPKWFH